MFIWKYGNRLKPQCAQLSRPQGFKVSRNLSKKFEGCDFIWKYESWLRSLCKSTIPRQQSFKACAWIWSCDLEYFNLYEAATYSHYAMTSLDNKAFKWVEINQINLSRNKNIEIIRWRPTLYWEENVFVSGGILLKFVEHSVMVSARRCYLFLKKDVKVWRIFCLISMLK